MEHRIRTILRRGSDHKVYCEDSNFFYEDRNIVVMAVFDGCSSGYRSHFASELLAKCLRVACNKMSLDYSSSEIITLNETLVKMLVSLTYAKLKETATMLNLSDMHLVSTMVLAVIDTDKQNACVVFSGDGFAYVNGNEFSNEQNNIPDYMAYHMHDILPLDFAKSNHIRYEWFSDVKDISVSTDGISSYNTIPNSQSNPSDLFTAKRFLNIDVMLERHYNIIKNEGFNHFDDLSIVRLIFVNYESV